MKENKIWIILCPVCATTMYIYSYCRTVPNKEPTLVDDRHCPTCGRDMTPSLKNVASCSEFLIYDRTEDE